MPDLNGACWIVGCVGNGRSACNILSSTWPNWRPRSEERRVGKECGSRGWAYQAEDGIRDADVTGVQTCALPISSQVRTGQPLGQALQDFMDYAGSCVMVAYHAGFERRMLDRGLRREWAQRLQHPFIDLAELAPMLHPDCQDRCHTLDDWQQHFHLTNSERHNAAADAMVSAELLLIMLNRLAREGTNTLAELDNRLARWRRLHRLRAVRL